MTRLAIALLALTSPVQAQDSAAWGNLAQFTVQLVPGAVRDYAVRAQNRVTGGLVSPTFSTLRLEGFSVAVRVDHADGDLPDTVTVLPPEGWLAVPPSIVLAEDAAGVIEICLGAGS